MRRAPPRRAPPRAAVAVGPATPVDAALDTSVDAGREAHESRVFTIIARFGWAVTGLLHIIIGGLAIAVAVAFLLLAGLIIVETLEADTEGMTGLDGAFTAVREMFVGPVIPSLICAGLVVYGLHGFARARLSRI